MIGPIDDSWYERPEGLSERVSSGGVVVRIAGGAVLVALVRELNDELIELDGYVLPKGGLEPGESIEDGAVREIREEIGLTEVTRLAPLATLERQTENKSYWSINHYGLYITQQIQGEIVDKEHHFGMDWFPLDDLPPLFWPDESRMLRDQRLHIYDLAIAHQNPKARKKYFM